MSDANHVILTRFNLPSPGAESLVRAREGWLRDRVALFERYCAPSVAFQTRRPEWLIYFDPESPSWLVERMQPWIDRGLFHPLYRESVTTPDLLADIRSVVKDEQADLVTTNLDNDDGLARDFCERLIEARTPQPRAALYLRQGLIKRDDRVYLRTDRRNAFVSVREKWDSPVTAWAEYHNEFHRLMPVVEVGGAPGWLQVVHGGNVSNRVRGRLADPGRFAGLFGDLIDDVPPVPRSAVLVDTVVKNPVRVVRDGARAGARIAGLRLLGKDGYGRAKHLLSSVLRGRRHSAS